MKFLKSLWQFSRPHTIIGSFLSITALFIIAWADQSKIVHPDALMVEKLLLAYLVTLTSALACNIYIVGLNQVKDVEIDKINKPNLPIPAGRFSIQQASVIVVVSLLISLATACMLGWYFLGLIALITAIGTAYSLPDWKFKKHHALAALSITVVRGVLVNLGMTVHFLHVWNGHSYTLPFHIIPLSIFVVGFSLGIAWFKDIPDTVGDEQYQIKTLALTITPQKAFKLGVLIVALSYLQVIVFGVLAKMPLNKYFLIGSHAVLLTIFLVKSFTLDLLQPSQVKRFYMFFWGLFFVEYIVYAMAYWV